MICASCHSTEAVTGETRCARCAPVEPFAPFVPPGPPLRSPVGLGRATAVLLGLVAVGDLAALWVDWRLPSDLAVAVVGGAQVALLVATAVVYLCWLWRVRHNADVFDGSSQSLGRWWAIAGWFVPIVNFWFPRRIVVEAWDASAPQGRPAGHALVNLWWTLWVASLLADRLLRGEVGVGPLALADSIDLVAAVLAAVVVLKLTRMQHEKALRGPLLPSAALG
ncbi:DUF4328 domain-containing protein [Streptomyces sp. NPDC048201]|uniref:DUF4328 domain-containing protein n=1 Tax=Streptomyces sp. NPDC048201 TaxID=3365513 RepID=UPI00371BEB23